MIIHKHSVIPGLQVLPLVRGAEILSVGRQVEAGYQRIRVWEMHDDKELEHDYCTILVVPTGYRFDNRSLNLIGRVDITGLVYHVFEVLDALHEDLPRE